MTILGGVTFLFLSILYLACTLSVLFLVVLAYCYFLEVIGCDPDSTPAFVIYVFAVMIPGMATIAYLFVSRYVPLMDWIIYQMGLTGA